MAYLENSLVVSPEVKYTKTILPISRYLLKKNENICLHKYLCVNVYSSSFIHNIQNNSNAY